MVPYLDPHPWPPQPPRHQGTGAFSFAFSLVLVAAFNALHLSISSERLARLSALASERLGGKSWFLPIGKSFINPLGSKHGQI